MRVLIVDHEPELRLSPAQRLRHEGYAVDTACDGESALFMADGGQYDAILLDLMLPRMDGWCSGNCGAAGTARRCWS